MSCEFLQNCKSLQYSDRYLHKRFSSRNAAHDLPFAALEPELLPTYLTASHFTNFCHTRAWLCRSVRSQGAPNGRSCPSCSVYRRSSSRCVAVFCASPVAYAKYQLHHPREWHASRRYPWYGKRYQLGRRFFARRAEHFGGRLARGAIQLQWQYV